MPFNRPPRLQTPLPDQIVRFPKIPQVPNRPDQNTWLTAVLPLGAMLLSVVLMIAFMGSGGGALNYMLFLPIMLVSYIVAFFTNNLQKKNYEKELEKARATLRAGLRISEEELTQLQKQELNVRTQRDPDLSTCVGRAVDADAHLGERRPGDADFLYFRLGIGKVPATYTIQSLPDSERPPEFEKELAFIDSVHNQYRSIPNVPILARLRLAGSIGIAGLRADVLDTARAMLAQVLVHHWLAEVKIAVACPPGLSADWVWLHSAPHASLLLDHLKSNGNSDHSDEPPSKLMAALEAELQRREQVVHSRKLVKKEEQPGADSIPLPRLIVVIDSLPENYRHPALSLLLSKGKELGVYAMILTDRANHIPGECCATIAAQGNAIVYQESGPEGYRLECLSDRFTASAAGGLVETLKKIDWPAVQDTSQPPETITFLDLFHAKTVEDLPIETWWDDHTPWGFLRTPIGRISKTSDLIFDLNDRDGSHGPHGLLGGMTGSGKSEVLKAIILSLALTHHPYDLNFALIDFKGGAAFNELSKLPHVVGVVTDIETNATFAERVILALSGEIERRKRTLEETRAAFRFGRSHIDEYRALPVRKPMPRLVIVFDEFAEFKTRNPAESKKLISIARQGRSLGVHLILATQNIEAAIDPEILQNSTFRICLRVSEPQDSVQMIGIPDAVNLTRGRAYFSANTRVLYQSAYSGATYISSDSPLPNTITRVWPDGREDQLEIPRKKSATETTLPPATQASAVVEYICTTARKMHLKHPPAVWPDALPERLYLPDLLSRSLTGGWDGAEWQTCRPWTGSELSQSSVFPILGLSDFPVRQRQIPLELNPEQVGSNLVVFGSPGSGKSTILRSLVTSVALTHTPKDIQIYILDYGGQSTLKILEAFPHVGAVITRLERERTERLIQFFKREVERRNDCMRAAHVDTVRDYNAMCNPEDRLPALYLIVDNFKDFKASFDIDFVENVVSLVSGGQAAGVTLIISSALQSDIPNELFANINRRITFSQADPTEYYRIVGQPSEAKLQEDAAKGNRPGRGLVRGTPPIEFQAALPTAGLDDKEQAGKLLDLAERMNHAWSGIRPQSIGSLPLLIPLSMPELELRNKRFARLGKDFAELKPVGFSMEDDGPAFLVAGVTQQTGKTTLLHSWLLSLVEHHLPSQLQLVLVDFHSRTLMPFRKAPQTCAYIGSEQAMASLLDQMEDEMRRRRQAVDQAYNQDSLEFDRKQFVRQWPHVLTVIDDYELFYMNTSADSNLRTRLAEAVKMSGGLGYSFIIAGTLAELPKDYNDAFIERFRKGGAGILLGGIEGIEEFNNTRRLPSQPAAGLPPGRGYLIRRGSAQLIQCMAYWDKDEDPADSLAKRLKSVG